MARRDLTPSQNLSPEDLLGKPVYSSEGNQLGIVDTVTPDRFTVRSGARIPKKVDVPIDAVETIDESKIQLSMSSTEFNRGIGPELEKMTPLTPEESSEREAFIMRVADRLGVDPERAEALTKLVFYMLSARMMDEQEDHLLEQLPKGVATMWFGLRQRGVIKFDRVEFLEKIKEDAKLESKEEALRVTQAVAQILRGMISPGEVTDIADSLPPGLREIWLGEES